MTPDEFRARILAIEARARDEIDLLSTVTARARPSAGESGAIADAVAGMARRQQNAGEIAAIEQRVRDETEALEAEFYQA